MRSFTKDETSLLLYLESRAVDDYGLLHQAKLNATDLAILHDWSYQGFVETGFVHWHAGQQERGKGRYVVLTEEAWAEAGRLRRERAARLWSQKPFKTEEEV